MRNLRQGPAVRTQREPLEGADQPALPAEPADRPGRDPGAPGARARLHALPPHPPESLSDSSYLGLGFLVAAIAAAVQYLGWARLGGARVTQGAAEERRLALRRWVLFTVAWQLAVLAFVGVYVALQVAGHARGGFWAAPAVGAVVGTALPLQVVVAGILRSVR